MINFKENYNKYSGILKKSKTFERFLGKKEGIPSILLCAIILLLPFILLFIAIFDMDTEYYTFLRWVICLISIFSQRGFKFFLFG